MPTPASQPDEKKVHQVWWEAGDWQRILRAAEARAEQTQLTATPTDIIRIGALRYADEVLSDQPAKAS